MKIDACVKLMGRDSGFIAAAATLANSDVNFCLIPEEEFSLEGEEGLLRRLEKRFERKDHAVIVVAEGAGQNLMQAKTSKMDESGNAVYGDIGLFLKDKIKGHFKSLGKPVSIKYIDPSYNIRSCPANARDSILCLMLGENAVHAAMAGKTDMFIGFWNQSFTHIPLSAAIGRRKKVHPVFAICKTIHSSINYTNFMIQLKVFSKKHLKYVNILPIFTKAISPFQLQVDIEMK